MSNVRPAHRDINFGKGSAAIGSGEVGVFSGELPALIVATFESPSYKPPVAPSVALELHRAVSKPNVQFSDLEPLLRKDPMLAGRVLQIAQSPAYAGRSRIASLKDAAVRLGLGQLASLFLETSLTAKLFKAPGYEQAMEEILAHSVAVARAARILAPMAKLDADHAFLCALLHDIGFVASLIALAEAIAKKKVGNVPVERALPAVEEVHTTTGGIIAKLWGLPDDVRSAIETHHRILDGQNRPVPYSALLVVAEAIAPQLRAPLHVPTPPQLMVRAAMTIGLDGAAVGDVQRRMRLKPPTRL